MKNEFTCDCNIIHQEIVEEIQKKMYPEERFKKLATIFKLIGDPTRCKILFTLTHHEMCVCDLANVLNMTKSSISHQLAILRNNGVVRYRKSGKEVYYTLEDIHITKLFQMGLDHINHLP